MTGSVHPYGGWIVVCLCWVLASFAVTDARAQETNTFAAAVAAFEGGDYPRALELFEQAHDQGLDSAALHYNIGVCQYRVGDYAQAAATFRAIGGRFPALSALADYNLGLALVALDRRDEARAAFERARALGDERLAALASSALVQFGPRPFTPTPPARPWLGYFDATLAHDDNVALVDGLSLPTAASASSAVSELLGYASRRVATRVPLRLDFSGYLARYADASEFDQDALRVDLSFEWSVGLWRLAAGPLVGETTLDHDIFERTVGAALRAARPLNQRLAFDVRLLYDDIDSPTDRFAFMIGTREQVRFGLERRTPGRRLSVAYEIDRHDRADPSVSPQRERIAFGYQRKLNAAWSVDGALAYRQSRYAELAEPRDERLSELSATMRRDMGAGWVLDVEYRWLDNDSNISQFSYRSHRIGVGVSRIF